MQNRDNGVKWRQNATSKSSEDSKFYEEKIEKVFLYYSQYIPSIIKVEIL